MRYTDLKIHETKKSNLIVGAHINQKLHHSHGDRFQKLAPSPMIIEFAATQGMSILKSMIRKQRNPLDHCSESVMRFTHRQARPWKQKLLPLRSYLSHLLPAVYYFAELLSPYQALAVDTSLLPASYIQ